MNRMIYISIGVIWLILLAVVVAGVLVAPDLDVVGNLQKYKKVGQQYLDRKDIDPATIIINSEDDKFVKAYAEYMRAFQISENEYLTQQRLFKVSLDPQNLASIEQITNAYEKLDNLAKQTQASYDILVKAQETIIASIKALDAGEMKVYNEVLEQYISEIESSETKFRDNITQYRLAIEKYYKAILDFLSQKQGAYSVQNGQLIFVVPEEQQYYEQLIEGTKKYEQDLNKEFDNYQQALRKSNSEIPVEIK